MAVEKKKKFSAIESIAVQITAHIFSELGGVNRDSLSYVNGWLQGSYLSLILNYIACKQMI